MLTNPVPGGDSRHSQLPPLLRQAVVAHEAGLLDTAYPLYRRFVDENANHPTALQQAKSGAVQMPFESDDVRMPVSCAVPPVQQ